MSSGSQHRQKEADGAYGEWVKVEKKTEKPSASSSSGPEETSKEKDSVFPEAPSQVSVQLLKRLKHGVQLV